MELLIITGPPYSGKGTQCELLEAQLGYRHISTGELCRAETEAASELGEKLKAYKANGELVPDETMKQVLAGGFDQHKEANGFILDGYPRTIPQIDNLVNFAQQRGLNITRVLNIDVPEEELFKRAMIRAANSEREDDKDPETHKKRIEIFKADTLPAIHRLKEVAPVIDIDGMGTKEQITARIREELALT